MLQANPNQVLSNAVAAHRAGRYRDAIVGYEQVLRFSPNSAQVLDMLGVAQNSVGLTEEGRKNILKAIRIAPGTAQFHHDLSLTYKREGNFARSHACLDEALRLAPGQLGFRAGKSELHFMAGEFEAAMAMLEPMLKPATSPGGTPAPLPASVIVMFGTIAPKVKRQAEAIEMLDGLLARTDVPPAQRMKALFTLGAVCDSVDQYDKAFDAYQRGNAIYSGGFDSAYHRNAVSSAIAGWTPEAIARMPKSSVDGSRVVFIVGMPRSGTTLVEQIVSAAPNVHAAGELNDMVRLARTVQAGPMVGLPLLTNVANVTARSVSDTGRAYMEMIRKLRVGDAKVLDKLPLNFLNLGLIQQALPGAKVIHCRREPLDSCLSCYFQLFDGNLGFAYDLAAAGRFYVDYERLMAHWHAVLSLPILDVQYETMVADQEGTSRRIFEFLGLPWTDSALRFHESKRTSLTSSNSQVRQPVYNRSVGRHRHYEKYLGPLRAALSGS